jgi:hypothetical protein
VDVLSAIGGDAFWSAGAEVIVGLVVAVVFVDVSATESARTQVRWYGKLRVAALLAIAGGLGACLAALAADGFRTVASAVVVAGSVAVLAGLVGTRLIRLRAHALRDLAAEERARVSGEENDDGDD